MSEMLLGLVVLSATRSRVLALPGGHELRLAWFRLFGRFACRCDWPDGLWVEERYS